MKWACKRIIIDTKWKLPKDNRPKEADLHQLFTYKLYFQAHYAFLLYPSKTEVGIANAAYTLHHYGGHKHTNTIFNTLHAHGGIHFLKLTNGTGRALKDKAGFTAFFKAIQTHAT